MNLKQLHADISEFYAAHGDPAVIKKYSRYFREGYDAYGVPDDVLRPFREQFMAEHAKELTVKNSLALGRLLMSSGKYEEAMTAIVLARRVLPQLTAASVSEFEYWLDHYVTNWAVCDTLCGQLLTPLVQNGTLGVNRVHSWAGSASRWSRRALAVTLIPFVKAAPHLAASMMMGTTVLLHDSEREVQQGLGWFLRECWKLDPQPVEKLLLKHKDTAPRLVYQYACEKMDKAAKERFKRGKQAKTGSAP